MRQKPLGRSSTYVLFLMVLMCLVSLESRLASAEEMVAYPSIQVDRLIQIENGGAVVANDTVTLSSSLDRHVGSLDSFRIGLPSRYENALVYFFAYDASGRIKTKLDISGGGTGFSWVDVSFPKSIDVNNGRSYDFTVVYVFSGLVESNQTQFHVDFPAYPSLVQEARSCNVTVMPPTEAVVDSFSPVFLNVTMDSRQFLYSWRSPLEPYANVSSWVEFADYSFLVLEVGEWRREINIDGWGGLTATDFYQITNKANNNIAKLSFILPPNATGISAQDVYGTYAPDEITVKSYEENVEVDIYLQEALGIGRTVKLLIVYRLPFSQYSAQRSWQDYALDLSLARPHGWVVKRSAVTFSLPEGAEFQASSGTPYVKKEGLLTKVEFVEHNATEFHDPSISLEYRYLILWASFRPTLWVGTAAAILGGIFFMRKATKPVAVAVTPLSTEVLRKFVDAYEERRRVKSEMESLEKGVQKGKISRRRYKLRKSSLDGHLSRLQRNLEILKKEIEATGGRHLERIRQLDTAEAEIETLERDIERVEIRSRRKEISAEASRRLLDEYNRIRERAENTIAEMLLRLREEIR